MVPSTVFAIDPDVIVGDVEGEIVALRPASDAYLHLNSTGSFIFERLRHRAVSLADLCAAATGRYHVDIETAERETVAFLSRCLELGLIREESL